MLVRCRCALVILVAACLGASCADESPTSPSGSQPIATFLSFTSSPGDFIGQGATRRFEAPTTGFSGQMVNGNRRLELRLSTATSEAWFLDIAAAPGQQLTPGTYTSAPSASPTGLAFSFSGAGHGCSVGVSDFEILEAVYATPPPGSSPLVSGIVERFRARFTQRCNGPASPPLNGEVSISTLTPNRCATSSGACQ
jgi:hypothetical protein